MGNNRMREWLAWKVILPFLFLVLMWPIYCIFLTLSPWEAFHHAFAHCELLIFSSLVFIEIAIEVGYLDKNVRAGIGWWQDVARVLAFLAIFLYGFIVADVIRLAQENKGGPDANHGKLIIYSGFACSFAVFAVSTSVYTFWRVKQIELSRRAQKAREPRRVRP